MQSKRSRDRAWKRIQRGIFAVALTVMQVLAVLPLASSALAANVVTTPGASFTTTPQEGATSLKVSYVLANSSGNIYPWEQRPFYMDGICADPYGEPKAVYSAGAGSHSSGKSDTLDLPCPEGMTVQRFTIWSEAAGVLLEWKTGIAPLPPPPPPPGVTVQVDGAKFTRVPVAGSPRFQVGYELKSTPNEYMLGDSEGYPWEMDSFLIEALCVNSAGQYKSVYGGLAGRHPGGKKDDLDVACPTGMTAGRFAVTMLEGPRRNELMLEWIAPVTDPIGDLRIDPAEATAHAGTTHRATVTVVDEGGAPVSGAFVNIAVVSGPNAGVEGTCENPYLPFTPSTCQTDGNGEIVYRYRGASVGIDQIKAFADMDGNGTMTATEPRATAQVEWVAPIHYAALGDSFSSGEGLAPFFEGSDTGDNECHRSERAYSTLVTGPHYSSPIKDMSNEPTHGVMWDFIACSGAVTTNVVRSGSGQHNELPQLSQGRVGTHTDLVTMSIGGNDVGFADILKLCSFRRCTTSSYKPLGGIPFTEWVPAKIDATERVLVDTYHDVQAEAPEAAVVIVGYPHLFPATSEEQTCAKLFPWDTSEQTFLRSMSVRFNDRLTEATATSGVHYVDPMSRWAGHEICGNGGEWIHALTIYVDTIPFVRVGPFPIPYKGGPTDQSFHPNATGQAAYAAQVDDYLRAAVAAPDADLLPSGLPSNPDPVFDAALPMARRRVESSRRSTLQQTVAPTGPLGSIGDASVAPADLSSSSCRPDGVYARHQEVRVSGHGFVPGSEVALDLVPYYEAESEPLSVGTADADGLFEEVVRIPRSTSPTALAAVEVKGSDAAGGDRLLVETFAIDESNFLCDDAPPAITIEAPVEDGSYLLGQDAAPAFTCTDEKSGVETCTTETAMLDTSTPGLHSFTVRATDLAGNQAVATVHYAVHYNFDGFFAPVNREPVVNKATAGQTIPLKWRITNATGLGVSDPASFVGIRVVRTACDDSAPIDVIEVNPETTGLKYHGDGYWQMNWRSPSTLSGSCATVSAKLADGVTTGRAAAFVFK